MKKIMMLIAAMILISGVSARAEQRLMGKEELYKWISHYSEDVEVTRSVLCEKVTADKFAKKDKERVEQALRTGCWSAGSLLNNLDLLMKYPDSIAQSLAVLRDISDTLDALSILVNSDSDLELRYLQRVYYSVYTPHLTFYNHLLGLAVEKDKGTKDIIIVK